MKKLALALAVTAAGTTLSGCLSHAVRVEPITVAPVQVTMDVNLHVDDDRDEDVEDVADVVETAGGSTDREE